jgi:chloramphenicol 3-O phosphotransferase
MLDELDLPEGEFRTDSDAMRRITRGWHRAIAAIAAEGNDVLVDELWTHRWWLEDWREVLHDVRWWSILLTAGPEALAAREAERGDRPEGLAVSDLADSPDPALFDLVIDTTNKSVQECTAEILAVLQRPVW